MYYDERENNFNYSNESDVNSYSKSYDNDIKIDVGNININNFRKDSDKLYSLEEGLNKGNSFVSEYNPYKKYIYRVIVKGDKDSLLLKIQELTFRLIDLNLYLDLYPTSNLYNEFKSVVSELNKYKEMYEKEYGPLCLTSTYYNEYKWSANPWPWMNEGGNN